MQSIFLALLLVLPGVLVGPGLCFAGLIAVSGFPDPSADWHLLAGDDAALPAIASALEALPSDAVGEVVVEVDSEQDHLPLTVPDGAAGVATVAGVPLVGALMWRWVKVGVRRCRPDVKRSRGERDGRRSASDPG